MLTDNEIIIALATIAVLGIGGQWIGRYFQFPSLLLHLPAGLLAGDVLGLVEPRSVVLGGGMTRTRHRLASHPPPLVMLNSVSQSGTRSTPVI
ncbi:MAG: hypothetical protein OEV40_25035 [Acidimicrobiia bacterium]|nr:hypothetical protein [Acidimicrobiia bacterium]